MIISDGPAAPNGTDRSGHICSMIFKIFFIFTARAESRPYKQTERQERKDLPSKKEKNMKKIEAFLEALYSTYNGRF